ncbi:MAG: HAD family phosphatase [Nodosilinea sp. LVE1205-7]|jgi:HAD superfamily hydrolase (TIGR01509 family)
MVLKAILLDFNGIVINDEGLHQQLIEDLLLAENLRPTLTDYSQLCRGRTDQACITSLWERQGRVITPQQLQQLLTRKTDRYRQAIATMANLPLYPGLEDLLYQIRAHQLKLAIVSGARQQEIQVVLDRAGVAAWVDLIVSGDQVALEGSKPAPDSYLLAIRQLNQQFPDLALQPQNCVAIEDSFAGIEAARRAGVPVVGVAHSYPYHMLHRRADWVVDYLCEVNLAWLQPYYDVPGSSSVP